MDTLTGVMTQAISAESPNESVLARAREFERKFVVPAESAARFLEAIESRTALELADRARPVSYNRTTYLDTPDRAFFRSGGTGIARKLRIREYANARVPGAPPAFSSEIYFEIKESGNGFRSKVRVPLAGLAAELFSSDMLATHPSLSSIREVLAGQRVVPMLTTFYRRVRRTCLDAPVCVTVDTDVRFSPPVEPGCALICASPLYFLRGAIIEIKTAGVLPAWLVDELGQAGEATAFSKFEHGMRLLEGRP